jgi:hypothetical protein
MFNNLTISAGGSRTFIMTADTTNAFGGKTQGVVTISPMLDGSTGTNGLSWSTGVMEYYYTPVGGSENGTAYTASDSYDVIGGSLSRSI